MTEESAIRNRIWANAGWNPSIINIGTKMGARIDQIAEPLAFESLVSQWPGVVTVGVFAFQKASVCLLGTADGVQTLTF